MKRRITRVHVCINRDNRNAPIDVTFSRKPRHHEYENVSTHSMERLEAILKYQEKFVSYYPSFIAIHYDVPKGE